MPVPFAAISAGASVVSAIGGFLGGSKASKAAKRAAAEAARQEGVVTQERVRQIAQEERTLAGQTVARTAGSGSVVTQGSPLQILAEQKREFAKEGLVVRLAGASRASAALASGRSVAAQASAQGLSALFAGIGQAANIAYNNPGLFSKNPPADR
jgi:hypothetical protein